MGIAPGTAHFVFPHPTTAAASPPHPVRLCWHCLYATVGGGPAGCVAFSRGTLVPARAREAPIARPVRACKLGATSAPVAPQGPSRNALRLSTCLKRVGTKRQCSKAGGAVSILRPVSCTLVPARARGAPVTGSASTGEAATNVQRTAGRPRKAEGYLSVFLEKMGTKPAEL